jgi:hypothetical protein
MDEIEFATTFLNKLKDCKVAYKADYISLPVAPLKRAPGSKVLSVKKRKSRDAAGELPRDAMSEVHAFGAGAPFDIAAPLLHSLTKVLLDAATVSITVKLLKAPIPGYTLPTSHALTVALDTPVVDFKDLLYGLSHIPPSAQRLVIKGKALLEDKSLEECGVLEGATLHLLVKPGCESLIGAPDQSVKENAPTKMTIAKPEAPSACVTKLQAPKPEFWDNLQAFLHGQFHGNNGTDAQRVFTSFRDAFDVLLKEDQ